ncbi:MAG TPA: bifunctional nicotinamidase/pyrazinamidase [Salinimicrobium sp.]|nr:bifunctional nicotinamidase/pyrazinamidase [Salinimicrobium sp.]
MRTLILVDIQVDFMPGGALEVSGGDKIIPVVNSIIPKFDLVIATQDWHPENHKSFASNHPGRKEFETIKLGGMDQTLWPDHCVQGTRGAEFHTDLQTNRIEAVFRKGMESKIDSYSGFFDNGHKKTTGLAGYLREKGAGEIFFCGLAGDICVYYSLIDALEQGFETGYIEDGSMPLDPEGFEKIRKDMIARGAKIITSSEI